MVNFNNSNNNGINGMEEKDRRRDSRRIDNDNNLNRMSYRSVESKNLMEVKGGTPSLNLVDSGDEILIDRPLELMNQDHDEEEEDQLSSSDNNNKTRKTTTKIRLSWLCCTYSLTWWIPSFLLTYLGRMKRHDIRLAWREKVALCLIIFLLSAIVVVFIIGINPLMCPQQEIFTELELSDTKGSKKDPKFSLYGRVYDFHSIRGIKYSHYQAMYDTMLERYSGINLDSIIPIQINPNLCRRYDGQEIHQQVSITNVTSDPLMIHHDHRWYRGDFAFNPYWFDDVVRYRMKKVGDMAYSRKDIEVQGGKGRLWFMYEDKNSKPPVLRVYDFTRYNEIFLLNRENEPTAPFEETQFLGPDMMSFIESVRGTNATQAFHDNIFPDEPEARARVLQCMNNLFYAGIVDDRNSIQCVFAQYSLLAVSIFLFMILFVKFLASLQLGSRPEPEDHDDFVICNVPCYTEDEESLRRTIESLAILKYDDKRKLLMMVADGMVIGGGNDLPTPQILLNLLGTDPSLDPEPLSFISLGEGSKQHNMGKVYTGLYEVRGHVVPYIVIVKVGRPIERQKPGNRGKRDSQLILMRFFNKLHYDHPMVPLELEMYHQIKYVIGVNPHFYEFVLMVDADTVVMSDSLNRLVSVMTHDVKVMGVCGETSLMNEKDSWATMIQVYEYFISHHLSKTFESLFGSVTCLPGCFSMYRLRSMEHKPLLIHDTIIEQYSENRVDTLHMKNLLHLGEDRYLTTLLLKNFPFHKTKFTPDAKCITNAPDTWDVLLSQRRRWINSTIHNLMELVMLNQLCGMCCFSMRFVVLLDLFSTVIMPATLGYLGYLMYRLLTDHDKTISLTSLFFIIAPFALQMLVFLLRRQWQYIGWMVIYLCALPVFAFFIPLYSFWNFDDFSWGNTRVVLGENKSGKNKKKKQWTIEEIPFDPKTIPTRRWSELDEDETYQWEIKRDQQSYHSTNSSRATIPRSPPQNQPSPPIQTQFEFSPILNSIPPQLYRPSSPYHSSPPIQSYRPHSPYHPPPQLYRPHSPYHSPPPIQSFRAHSPYRSPPIPLQPLPPSSRSNTPTLPPSLPPLPPHYPSPSIILHHMKLILAHNDLMSLSQRELRDRLGRELGLDFHHYKEQVQIWLEYLLRQPVL